MKYFYSILIIISYSISSFAQVGIGTIDPAASSILDINSTNKGLLIPRVLLTNTTTAAPVSSPAVSLLVYNLATTGDVAPGFYYWTGSVWKPLVSSSGASTTLGTNVKSYGERYYNADVAQQLQQYDVLRNLSAGVVNPVTTANIETSGVVGLRPTIGGVYKVTLTVTYSKEVVNNTVNSVEFYLSKNEAIIENTRFAVDLNDDLKRRTFTMVKFLKLEAYQTYHFGIEKVVPSSGTTLPKIILHKNLTNMSIEFIN